MTTSILGFGSLLSETSARSTVPDLVNFRLGKLHGWRRVFAHTAPIFFERGIAKIETMEISSLSVEKGADSDTIVATLFDIPNEGLPAFHKREEEFRIVKMTPTTLDGAPEKESLVCVRYENDAEWKADKGITEEVFERMYGRWGVQQVFRDDVLPCRLYLRHCVLAAQKLGPDAHDNFLDATYLADRKTTIREYLATHPDIMNEEPPENLKTRYSG